MPDGTIVAIPLENGARALANNTDRNSDDIISSQEFEAGMENLESIPVESGRTVPPLAYFAQFGNPMHGADANGNLPKEQFIENLRNPTQTRNP